MYIPHFRPFASRPKGLLYQFIELILRMHPRKILTRRSVLYIFVFAALFAPIPARAATITLTTCNASELIGAINTANGDVAPDIIELKAGCTDASAYTLTVVNNGSESDANGLPVITTDLTINGFGSAIQRDGAAPRFRIFQVNSGAILTLNDVIISGGHSTDDLSGDGGNGGGIKNSGTLNLIGSTVSGNTTGSGGSGGGIYNSPTGTLIVTTSTLSDNRVFGGTGGAIHNAGSLLVSDSFLSHNVAIGGGGGIYHNGDRLTVTNSTLAGNEAGGSGGGIFNNGSSFIVSNSTFSGNSAGFFGGGIVIGSVDHADVTNSTFADNLAHLGGGIANLSSTLTIINSTFAGNRASLRELPGSASGGGIHNSGTLTIINSTLSGNSAVNSGGGISSIIGTSTFRNTIVANNIAPSGANCSVAVGDGGGNLDNGTSCGFTDSTSKNNVSAGLDPGGLQDNGGPNKTIALLAGSLAIDMAVDENCPSTDQRGMMRPSGAHCDIGAYEFDLPIVRDTTPPVLTLPTPATLEATSSAGAIYTFTAIATNDTDPAPSVSCDPPSGSTFPLGLTQVTCTATDASGNSGEGSFVVIVVDTTPPALTIPGDLTVECNTPGGASSVVLGVATAVDLVDPSPIVANNAPTTLPLGSTPVLWTATDFNSNSTSAVQTVTIVDTTPPTITPPPDIEVIANTVGGYTGAIGDATAADICDSSPIITNDAPSVLPLGETIVAWTATDASANSDSATQLITVRPIPVVIAGDSHNINLRSKGVIPLALLTTETFDATTIDPLSVHFGPAGAIEVHHQGHFEDVDGDGDQDLVLHFETQATGIQCGDASATLTGQTLSGLAIEGIVSINTECK